jgi:hypothetical protein
MPQIESFTNDNLIASNLNICFFFFLVSGYESEDSSVNEVDLDPSGRISLYCLQ